MALDDDIRQEVRTIFRSAWTERDGTVIPQAEDLKLGNDAVKMRATILYADLAESTAMVNRFKSQFAAEVYKAFLISACRIIQHRGGEITAFDGDRIMAAFNSARKNNDAARAALNINWVVAKVVNEELKDYYKTTDYKVSHAVGVDCSDLFIARTGVWGANDLVWVGRAANYAAKLCTLRSGSYVSWITSEVYSYLDDEQKYANGSPMWEQRSWNGITVYRSSYLWAV